MSDMKRYSQSSTADIVSESSSAVNKTSYLNRLVIVGCVVCVATTIIVTAIAVPLSKNAVRCTDCKDRPCPATTPAPETTPPSGATTPPTPEPTPDQPGPAPVKRSTRATTSLGTYVGHEVDMGTGNPWENCMSFLGIRFAKANPGRWERPEKAEPFSGDYIADRHRTMCSQGGGIFRLSGQGWWTDYGEDCLFLDIFSPMDTSKGPYPVMLYFYGGAYQSGGTIMYPGQTLVHKDVVVVVMNYRVGIFGFASTGDGYLKGNYGLWDQRMSMIYVKEHIAAFGGDPNRVTIFGQSAGAGSIGMHLISPNTSGLFQQALYQSGSELAFWALNSPKNHPETFLPQVADNAGCNSSIPTEEWVACLKSLSDDDLRRYTSGQYRFECNFCLGFVPTIDGEFVPEHPWEILQRGEHHDVPIMLGANNGECNLYVLGDYPWTLPENAGWNRTAFQAEMIEVVSWFSFLMERPELYTMADAYNLFNLYYTPWGNLENPTLNKEQLGEMCSDGAWTANNAQVLKMRARTGQKKIYQYINGISPAPVFPPLPGWIRRGVPHQFEIPHIWGYPTVYFGTEELKNDSANLHVPPACWSVEDVAFTEFMQTLWTNFAKYGDPTPDSEPLYHPKTKQRVKWEAYDNEDYYYFYMDNEDAGSHKGFHLREAALFNEYIMYKALGFMSNPDEVQFVPYPSEVTSSKVDAADVGLSSTDAPRRGHGWAEAFRKGMTGEIFLPAEDGLFPLPPFLRDIIINRLNETLMERRNITIDKVYEMVLEFIDGNLCIETTGYFWRGIIEDNQEEIVNFIREFIEELIGSPIPTLPSPTRPTFRPPG